MFLRCMYVYNNGNEKARAASRAPAKTEHCWICKCCLSPPLKVTHIGDQGAYMKGDLQ